MGVLCNRLVGALPQALRDTTIPLVRNATSSKNIFEPSYWVFQFDSVNVGSLTMSPQSGGRIKDSYHATQQ